ncbi:uncharacterized protein LOC124778710 [Schistocerca piceifrons]|uniref:uncharacterized protein LOC124778710 n=1 Tax=Schistocerca piceifrons TaxID=274613 RepID=UPI001F5EDC3D|nr:uncharacterized protein LOC124778710 [Schistocerca piceifrons]
MAWWLLDGEWRQFLARPRQCLTPVVTGWAGRGAVPPRPCARAEQGPRLVERDACGGRRGSTAAGSPQSVQCRRAANMTSPPLLLLLLPLPWVALAVDLGAFHEAVPALVQNPELERARVTPPGPRAAPETVTAEVESLLEPPPDVGPAADAGADLEAGRVRPGGHKQEMMHGLRDRYAASHVGRHHDMNNEVNARRQAHRLSEVEDLQGKPIVSGGLTADVETVPQSVVSDGNDKPSTPSIDDDNDFLREDGWKPKSSQKAAVLGEHSVNAKNVTAELTSGTNNKSTTRNSANSDDDNDFLRSDTWETKAPHKADDLGEPNAVTTQDVSDRDSKTPPHNSDNSDDNNDFLRDDSWEPKPAPEVKARDDKSSAPAVGNNEGDDFLRDDTPEAVAHKVSATGETSRDNKASAPPFGNNVDDNDFLKDDSLETVIRKPVAAEVNTGSEPAPNVNGANEKSSGDSGRKSDDDNDFLREDDLQSKPHPAGQASLDADVERVPSSGARGRDDSSSAHRDGNDVDDNDFLRDDAVEVEPQQYEPAVRGGRNADADAAYDDEDESPNDSPQGSHAPEDHVRSNREEDTDDRDGEHGEGAGDRHDEDKDGGEEGGSDGAGDGRKGGEDDLAWAGRRPLDGTDWPKWAGGDGPHGSMPPRYSGGGGGGFGYSLGDGEKLPDEERYQRQAPSSTHQGGPWVQQWLARSAGAGAGGERKAAEAVGAARAAAAEAARRAAHRSSFRRGWRGSDLDCVNRGFLMQKLKYANLALCANGTSIGTKNGTTGLIEKTGDEVFENINKYLKTNVTLTDFGIFRRAYNPMKKRVVAPENHRERCHNWAWMQTYEKPGRSSRKDLFALQNLMRYRSVMWQQIPQ